MVELLREGRAALHTSFACFKFLIIYGLSFSILKLCSNWWVSFCWIWESLSFRGSTIMRKPVQWSCLVFLGLTFLLIMHHLINTAARLTWICEQVWHHRLSNGLFFYWWDCSSEFRLYHEPQQSTKETSQGMAGFQAGWPMCIWYCRCSFYCRWDK